MSGSDHPVVVVGAGLAGLACASTIHAAGRPVRVLEASDGVGGRVRTDIVDGFRLDRGFQVMLTAYPELHRQLDPERLELCRFDPGALVQDGDRASVLSDPFRAPGRLIGTVRSPAATIADKARIVGLRHRLRTPHPSRLLAGDDIPTVDALRDAGFSDRVIDRFFRPLVGGIQLDPSLESSRRMFDIIFRMLADGDAAVPRDGMQAIPDQLARNLPDGTIELGAPVVSVAPGVVRTEHGEVRASTVVVATEGPAAARLLDLPDVASRSAGAVWFAADAAPTDERLVVLDGRGGPVLNAAVMSNVAPSYAPAGRHLIVAALPGITDGDLESTARATMRSWWGGEVDSWQVVGVNRIAHGQPVQNPPFAPKQRTRIDDGLYVCGDHRDTASIQGALFSGRRCGEAVLAATTDTVSP